MKRFLVIIFFTVTSLFASFGSISVNSSTHSVSTPSKDTTITFTWSAPSTDGGTVLNGYYYKFDQNSNTLVGSSDATLSDSATSISQTASNGDGDYYFHIAAYATNGDISATYHFGPIKIDTTAPGTNDLS